LDIFIIVVFVVVYAGMILGEVPGLALDRSGIALLGAISVLAGGRLTLEDAWLAIDVHTIALLFGLMVISAQFRLGGFYTETVRRISAHAAGPDALLLWVVAAAGALSSVLANDIVCLAMAPMLIEVCARRNITPVPFLLALASASNVGSAATLIGNPQNMFIGESLRMPFARYVLDGGPPAVLGLAVTWMIIRAQWRGRWTAVEALRIDRRQPPSFDRWQTAKGVALLTLTVAAFLLTSWPRDVLALTAAGLLLLSRRMASREMIALVDWHLLVLFIGLFVVNHAVERAGLLGNLYAGLASAGVDLTRPEWLFVVTPALSNLVSNVPAVMLLLPASSGPHAGAVLALASTFAGNLLIVGSIANIIVVEEAGRRGVRIDWRAHARTGLPVTLATLAIAASLVMDASVNRTRPAQGAMVLIQVIAGLAAGHSRIVIESAVSCSAGLLALNLALPVRFGNLCRHSAQALCRLLAEQTFQRFFGGHLFFFRLAHASHP
jgi:Na+/H+ antiporter NhaD/arsenite permease-like protein